MLWTRCHLSLIIVRSSLLMKKKQPKFVFCLCTRLQDIHLSPEMQKEAQLGSCTGEEKGLCIFTGALSSAKVQQRSDFRQQSSSRWRSNARRTEKRERGSTGRSTCRRRCSEKHRREPGVGGRAAELAAAECWVMGRRVKVD